MDTTSDKRHDHSDYPVRFSVEYPDRPLNRPTTALRAFVALPIIVATALVSGEVWQSGDDGSTAVVSAGGLLFLAPALMILFRQKYPRWWFDWNVELQRLTNRVCAYLALMDDRYPSTTQEQSVRLRPATAISPSCVDWLAQHA